MTKVKLPHVLSVLVRLALDDLAKCEADPRYQIEMGEWHTPNYEGVCLVCFAGSVIAKTLTSNAFKETPRLRGFGNHNAGALIALDYLRSGHVRLACEHLKIHSLLDRELDRVIVHYDEDPATFRAEMNTLANDLEAIGL